METLGLESTSGAHSEPDGPSAVLEPVRVLVANDHQVLRRGLVVMLEDDPRLRVVDQVASLDPAERLQAACADVVVIDERLWRDRADALDAWPAVVLTTSQRATRLGEILSSGAAGCVNLTSDSATLCEAVRVVAAGGRYLADSVHDAVVQIEDRADPRPPTDRQVGYGMTPAELRVLAQLVRGMTNAQIADELHVSENTVKTQLSSVFRKLGVAHRSEATAVAIREGLVT